MIKITNKNFFDLFKVAKLLKLIFSFLENSIGVTIKEQIRFLIHKVQGILIS